MQVPKVKTDQLFIFERETSTGQKPKPIEIMNYWTKSALIVSGRFNIDHFWTTEEC